MPFSDYLADITVCLKRLTWLSLPADPAEDGRTFARSCWAYPVVGAVLGGGAGVIYMVAHALGLAPAIAAVIAIGSLIAVTGAAPERALARAASGLTRRPDSAQGPALGEWGTIALVFILAIRIGTVAAIAGSVSVAGALLGAGAIAYACLLAALYARPEDAPDADYGGEAKPPVEKVALAIAAAVIISLVTVPHGWIAAIVLAGAGTSGLVFLSRRREPPVAALVIPAVLPVAELLALLAIAGAR